ncbi:glycosyltransferase [Solitalea lacus]|uniref:glycosyltransferase n=1 Tax=Solitalea lacus TaxID=2911172 RepID=UPI001EDB4E0D|nr:glycosyltransferase [Solitalea lacus]UKJ07071.1 glycosyltransferase [Solitalea lacus]
MNENRKPRILICTTSQFGYLTDTYKYCEYAKNRFDITYICWDYNRPRIELTDIKVHYVTRAGNLLRRNYRLLNSIYNAIKWGLFDNVFIVYIRGVSFVKFLFPKTSINLDIRTASVHKNLINRTTYNFFLKLESLAFANISVISEGVAKSLGIKKYSLLPLGGENFKTKHIEDSHLTFIYVGSLQGRDILTFVKAFYEFSNNANLAQQCSLKIIGDSPENELQILKEFISSNKVKNIQLLGRINQDKLKPYFDNADIGISYVPITPWYEFQPPTKTYEYLVSGLPVLATATYENKKIITQKNGVLIKDNLESIVKGLHVIMDNYNKYIYDPEEIKKESKCFSWEYIVSEEFELIINRK